MKTKTYALNRSKFLDEAEQQSLQDTLGKFYAKADINSLVVRIALATGARAQELLNIKRIDLYDLTKTILIYGIKGSNDREIPISSELWNDLMIYLKTHQKEHIFPIQYHTLRRAWITMRPCAKSFHCLRHTFALELYKKRKDIRLVQLALGHKNIQNTEIYMSFTYSTEKLRELLCG